jgi:hypothetical protein
MTRSNRSFLDDNLALLSLRTAQEVDRRLHGGSFDPRVLAEFGEKLVEASGIRDAHETAFLCSEPTATEVFFQAIEEFSGQSVKDLEALTEHMRAIINPLIGDTVLSDETLREIKSFCLALHKSLVAQRHPTNFERENPFEEVNELHR